jgi:DNA-binding GntR family transcriptional regulator
VRQPQRCTGFLEYDDEFHGTLFYATGKAMSWRLIQSMSGHYRGCG